MSIKQPNTWKNRRKLDSLKKPNPKEKEIYKYIFVGIWEK